MLGFPHNYTYGANKRVDFENVETLKRLHINMMLDRTLKMFKWENLPESIPERFLEQYLQINGFVGIGETPEGLKAFFGGCGGVLDEYYMPTKFIVCNPWLGFNKEFEIYREYRNMDFSRENNAVIGLNDTLSEGLFPLIEKYATQLATNEITLNVASINSRAINILTATSESAYASIKSFLKDLVKGKIAHVRESIITDNDVRSLPFSSQTNNGITNLIELQQYFKASFYNEIGLNANYNMKRESIQQNESDMNHDSLKPLIDDMLDNRKKLADMLNECYGLNVSVDFNSIWLERMRAEEVVLEKLENEAEATEETTETTETTEENPVVNEVTDEVEEKEEDETDDEN